MQPDSRSLQTPLWTALCQVAESESTDFHTPGHNSGRGLPAPLAQLGNWGRLDLTELTGLDNLQAPTGVIREAQQLAAQAWGADETYFLVGGATAGVLAMLLATVGPGERVLLPRNCHQSLVHGLVLSGAEPVWLLPEWNGDQQLDRGLTASAVAAALTDDIRAVVVVSPTYFGATAELAGIIEVAQRRNLPVLVDAAHGSHFAFHPALPECAVALGADLVVHSAHKTLPALTQAALLHRRGARVDPARLAAALRLVQTSSPSYLLMASLDLARAEMVASGRARLTRTLGISRYLARRVPFAVVRGLLGQDATRLVFDVGSHGWSGWAAETWLEEAGIKIELATHRHLVLILNSAHTRAEGHRLARALERLARTSPTSPTPSLPDLPPPAPAQLVPRAAFFAPRSMLALEQAIGCTSAVSVAAYPPGIPILLPGERVTAEAVAYLQAVTASGGAVVGLDDQERIAIALDTLSI